MITHSHTYGHTDYTMYYNYVPIQLYSPNHIHVPSPRPLPTNWYLLIILPVLAQTQSHKNTHLTTAVYADPTPFHILMIFFNGGENTSTSHTWATVLFQLILVVFPPLPTVYTNEVLN